MKTDFNNLNDPEINRQTYQDDEDDHLGAYIIPNLPPQKFNNVINLQ